MYAQTSYPNRLPEFAEDCDPQAPESDRPVKPIICDVQPGTVGLLREARNIFVGIAVFTAATLGVYVYAVAALVF